MATANILLLLIKHKCINLELNNSVSYSDLYLNQAILNQTIYDQLKEDTFNFDIDYCELIMQDSHYIISKLKGKSTSGSSQS